MGPALALEVALSGELLLGRPRLGYARDGDFVLREDGWSVRPRLGVGMVIFP
ncbi:Biopterin-dependent aromatic amino acid hydroxylase family profile domain-containing protein [Corallococcus soli]